VADLDKAGCELDADNLLEVPRKLKRRLAAHAANLKNFARRPAAQVLRLVLRTHLGRHLEKVAAEALGQLPKLGMDHLAHNPAAPHKGPRQSPDTALLVLDRINPAAGHRNPIRAEHNTQHPHASPYLSVS
jgi:hypothetical protein